jgi:hypothetical protein
MSAARYLACALLALSARVATAQDQLDVVGAIDVRWIHATGDLSYLNGGMGILRFDPEHEGVRLGRAFLAPRLQITDIFTLHAVIDAYGDYGGNPLDLSEFWAEVRPFPVHALRWRLRLGAFHMPVSLENRGAGWSDVYSITPSALNTWLGEEFRTIGAELEARWLGSSRGYLGDIALTAGVYGWNDSAGELLADRGFALSDRPSTLFGGLGRPPTNFYQEIDHRPGYYAGLTWRHHDRLEVRALRYDNLADASATTSSGDGAWRTRFSSLGARLEPTAPWTFIAQYLEGDTAIGPNAALDEQFRMTYHAAFALASLEWRRERLSARFDDFHTTQTSGFYGPPRDEAGHAWTVGWTHDLGHEWQLAAEWIRVFSRFPPRMAVDDSAAFLQTQTQIAIRYRFRFGL